MTEKCNVLQCEAVPGPGEYYKLPGDFDVLPDDVFPLCATIKSDPDCAESSVENEESLLELVDVKTEEEFDSDGTTKVEFLGQNSTMRLIGSHMPKVEDQNQACEQRIEILDQRTIKLEKNRLRVMARRQAETEGETTKRRRKCAQRVSKLRANETEEQRQQRLEECRLRAAERRKNMTPVERELWRMKNRIQTRERRQNEDEIKKILRRHNNAIRAYLKRSHETEEEKMERRMKDALRAAERRKMETSEEREERLRKDRERVRLRRMERRTEVIPEEKKTARKRKNCSKYSHLTGKMLSILKSVQDYLDRNEIKREDISPENLHRLMLFVKSYHPDLTEAYVENAVHTLLSSRDSDGSGTSFSNDEASLLSMSDCSQSGSILFGGELSYCENFDAITEEIEIKQEPLEELCTN